MIYRFASPKGGIGTTATTALFALTLDEPTQLVDAADHPDLPHMFGLHPESAWHETPGFSIEVRPGLGLCRTTPGLLMHQTVVVMDCGTNIPAPTAAATTDVLVLGNSYMTIRRFFESRHVAHHWDRVVVITDTQRPLRAHDVAAAIGVGLESVVTVEHDVRLARTIDAGLLTVRVPRTDLTGLLAHKETR